MPATRQQDQSNASLASRTKSAPGNAPAQKSHRASATDCTQHWEDAEHLEQNKAAFQEFRAASRKASGSLSSSSLSTDDSAHIVEAASDDSSTGDHGPVPGGMKRGRGANQAGNHTKKAKSEDRDPAGLPRGDKTRVPSLGQHVHWKHGKGFAKGEVVEVLYEDKEIEGHKAEASKENPRLVLRTESSGRLAVYKPEDVYFD